MRRTFKSRVGCFLKLVSVVAIVVLFAFYLPDLPISAYVVIGGFALLVESILWQVIFRNKKKRKHIGYFERLRNKKLGKSEDDNYE